MAFSEIITRLCKILYKGVINQSQTYFTAAWEQPAHLKSFAIMKLIGWRSPGLNKNYFTVNPSACCTTTAPIINSAINIQAINSQSWWDTYCSYIAVTTNFKLQVSNHWLKLQMHPILLIQHIEKDRVHLEVTVHMYLDTHIHKMKGLKEKN